MLIVLLVVKCYFMQLRERIDKWNYMKLKSTTKEMVSKLKKPTTE
jgi:hypothetical protein